MLSPMKLGQIAYVTFPNRSCRLWREVLIGIAKFHNIKIHLCDSIDGVGRDAALIGSDTDDVLENATAPNVWLNNVLVTDKWPALIALSPKVGRRGVVRSPENLLSLVYDLKLTQQHRLHPNVLRDFDGSILAFLVHSRDQAVDFQHAYTRASEFRIKIPINTPDPRVQCIALVKSYTEASPETLYEVTRIQNPGSFDPALMDDTGIDHAHFALRTIDADYTLLIESHARVVSRIQIPDVLSDTILVFPSLNPYNGLEYFHGGPILFPTHIVSQMPARGFVRHPDSNFLTWLVVNSSLRVKYVPQTFAVNTYARTTPQGKAKGIVTAYQEGYRLQRMLLGRPLFKSFANRFLDSPVESYLRTWVDGSNYPQTFKYQAAAARLGAQHAKNLEPSPINDPKWLNLITDQIKIGDH